MFVCRIYCFSVSLNLRCLNVPCIENSILRIGSIGLADSLYGLHSYVGDQCIAGFCTGEGDNRCVNSAIGNNLIVIVEIIAKFFPCTINRVICAFFRHCGEDAISVGAFPVDDHRSPEIDPIGGIAYGYLVVITDGDCWMHISSEAVGDRIGGVGQIGFGTAEGHTQCRQK